LAEEDKRPIRLSQQRLDKRSKCRRVLEEEYVVEIDIRALTFDPLQVLEDDHLVPQAEHDGAVR